ncbi:hypothetical protein L195_g023546 [Trifolium pratense]|uniref:Uncharacterized protein n=1 Tax=Trifolium pratense TaxID=57577 RepID=A0A2K3NB84_TRIPR|nr:hypothetical protein L195_g023546 [Trifolium pratense]
MGAKYKLVKICSVEEAEEKMEMGICFICDKPFSLEHQLMHHKNIQITMKDKDEDKEVADNNAEKLKVDRIFPTNLNHVSTNKSPVPTPQTPIWTPVAISPTVEHEEGNQMQLDNHTLASTTVSQKSQPLVDSAPFLSYSPFDDNAEKSQGQEKIVTDPVLQNSCQLFDEKPQWHNSESS